MNKSLLLLAAAAMTLAACSNSDELTGNANGGADANSAPTTVQFSTYLAGGQTRASGGTVGAQTNTTLQTQGFGVFAYNTKTDSWSDDNTTFTPDFMYNQEVTYNSTDGWKYEPIKYWPNDFSEGNVDDKQGTNGEETPATGSEKGSKLSFFAYAPYVDAMGYTDAALTSNAMKHSADNDAIKTGDGTTAYDAGIIGMTFNKTAGAPYVRYHLASTDVEKAVDLLWGKKLKDTYALADGTTQDMSKQEYNTDLTKQAANEKIGFSFKHALARVGGNTDLQTNTTKKDEDNGHVKVILDIDNGKWDASTAITGGKKDGTTLVTVKEIKIRDYDTYSKESGAKTETYKTTTTGGLRQEGWFNLATGTWDKYDATNDKNSTDDATKISYSVDIKDGATGTLTLNPVIAEPSTAPSYSSSAWTATGVDGFTGVVDDKAISVYKTPESDGDNKDNGILMIPTTTGDNLNQSFVVTVDYLVRTYDEHLANNQTEIEQVITNAVNIPAGALEANKVYTLLIHLGLTSVKFEAEVANWDSADGTSTSGTGTGEGNEGTDNKKDIYLPSNTLATSLKVSANATTSITVPAETTSFTINLTGLTKDNTLTVDPSASVSFDNATVQEGGEAKATVTLTANEDATAKANKVVITEKNSSDETVTTTTVTINQAAKK